MFQQLLGALGEMFLAVSLEQVKATKHFLNTFAHSYSARLFFFIFGECLELFFIIVGGKRALTTLRLASAFV